MHGNVYKWFALSLSYPPATSSMLVAGPYARPYIVDMGVGTQVFLI
jgi:hypothetical protein